MVNKYCDLLPVGLKRPVMDFAIHSGYQLLQIFLSVWTPSEVSLNKLNIEKNIPPTDIPLAEETQSLLHSTCADTYQSSHLVYAFNTK